MCSRATCPALKAKAAAMVDAAKLEKLELAYKKLQESDTNKSLLKKKLARPIFENLKILKTPQLNTLLECIISGVENPDSEIGIYAPDADAYTVFADIFNPIIEAYHEGFKTQKDIQPPMDWGDIDEFGDMDDEDSFIISTRLRIARNIEGYPMTPLLTEDQFRELEKRISDALLDLEGELKGSYYSLIDMAKDVQEQLTEDHYLFKKYNPYLESINARRHWPIGRGVFHNFEKTFLVWVNEEDHLRIISMQRGGDLNAVYKRMTKAVNILARKLPFLRDPRLGYVTLCPSNLGTTVRTSIHITLRKLTTERKKLDKIANEYHLAIKLESDPAATTVGIFDISNKQRLGSTEFALVKEMYDGVLEIIKLEKELEMDDQVQ